MFYLRIIFFLCFVKKNCLFFRTFSRRDCCRNHNIVNNSTNTDENRQRNFLRIFLLKRKVVGARVQTFSGILSTALPKIRTICGIILYRTQITTILLIISWNNVFNKQRSRIRFWCSAPNIVSTTIK